MLSHHEEAVVSLGLSHVVLDEDCGQSESGNEEEEEGVVEVLLEQIEVVLWGETGVEDVETIGKDLSG